MPGLVSYDEVLSGEIKHAIRFTAPRSRHAFVWPARHYASSLTGTQYPRMGERFRLKAGVDISSYPACPSSASVRTGRIQPFTATVSGAANSVTWSVNGTIGGDAIVGSIDSSGQYFAPSVVPSPFLVTVRAAVTVLPPPTISSVTPSPVPTGAFTVTVNGAGFIAGSIVSFDGAALATTVLSNTFLVDVAAPAATGITISPTTATVRVRGTKQFTATVQNNSNTSVIWKVNNIRGGNVSVGTITASGLYRAPTTVPNPAAVTVSATASADRTKTANAVATISKK